MESTDYDADCYSGSSLMAAVRSESRNMIDIPRIIQREMKLVHEGCRIIDLALEMSVKKGLYCLVCVLLENGADANFVDSEVSLPLLNRAALNQDLRMLQELVRYGALPNYRQPDGMNALEELLYLHMINMDVFFFLVSCGCSIEVPLYHYPNLNKTPDILGAVHKHIGLWKA
jgi:hypothetical protein